MVRRSPFALESFEVFVALGIADDLAFECFEGVLQAFDKLAHDTDCRRLIFDLDGDLAAHMLILPKRGRDGLAAHMDLQKAMPVYAST
jgi:hypothetical protein